MIAYERGWVRLTVFDPDEEGPGDLDPWVVGHPRRRRASLSLHRREPVAVVAVWPRTALALGSLDDPVGVGLFRPTRLACAVCGQNMVALQVEADGCGVFDRWRDGLHDVLKACPSCGAGRRDAGLMGVLTT